jgi:hypothetical protein
LSLLDEVGEFSKIGDLTFFIETGRGNFIWNMIDNVLIACNDSYYEYLYKNCITKVKYKGKRQIKAFCGDKVKYDTDS